MFLSTDVASLRVFRQRNGVAIQRGFRRSTLAVVREDRSNEQYNKLKYENITEFDIPVKFRLAIKDNKVMQLSGWKDILTNELTLSILSLY